MSFLSTPQVIILLGPPGSGKGTHAIPLSNSLQLPHISTGDLFRSHLKHKTALGVEAKQYIDKGELVPDDLVLDILKDRVLSADCNNGYILDGFPRTYNQAVALKKILSKTDAVKVIYLSTSDNVLIERITGRLSCLNCNAVYHKTFSPPKNHLRCDECSNSLSQRKDDTEEIVRKRLIIYHTQTKPLIEYYKARGGLFEIDVNQDKDIIFDEIKSHLEEFAHASS